jgi:hypothetical protein
MDSAANNHRPNARKFPAYTITELKSFVANNAGNPQREAILAEIAARESGKSVVFKVPQIK